MTKYEVFREDCLKCQICIDAGLCEPGASPLLPDWEPRRTYVLFVLETPNRDPSGGKRERCLKVDKSDRTGEFMDELVRTVLGWQTEPDLFVTNSVLCLPRYDILAENFKVTPILRKNCSRWLRRLIDEFNPKIVCPLGGSALTALNGICSHHKTLPMSVAKPVPWYGRTMFPLYHTGGRAFKTRKPEQQHEDWAKLRVFLNGLPPLTAPCALPE